jgi:hypothetical protein
LTQKEPKESSRYILEEMTTRLGKDFRFIGHRVQLNAKNFVVYFIEYLNTLQNKYVIIIMQQNTYTANITEALIEWNDLVPEVDDYIKRGFILNNPDYKKYLSHNDL